MNPEPPTPKERPILFSGAMVRALLAGTKTQTRRVVKPQPDCDSTYLAHNPGKPTCTFAMRNGIFQIPCPYGKPGDRLWVRETWNIFDGAGLEYTYPNGIPKKKPHGCHVSYPADDESGINAEVFHWRPSIHMPRWASRILLEIVSIRVERLHDIREEDAMAEGIQQFEVGDWTPFGLNPADRDSMHSTARDAFASLWLSINGPGSWNTNPWVWVVTFKRIL